MDLGLAGTGSVLSLTFIAVSVVAAAANVVWSGTCLTALVGALSALLTLGIVVVIALSVLDQTEVNAQSILGAICIYVLLGMIFLFVYGAVAVVGHGPFFAQGTDGTRSLRLYFSYVTLATLGYGDYTPAGNFGHTLAVFEALLGQLYLVTVVAVLVAHGPAAQAPPRQRIAALSPGRASRPLPSARAGCSSPGTRAGGRARSSLSRADRRR